MKKLIAMLLALVLVLSLAACGDSGATEATAATEEPAAEETEETEEPAAADEAAEIEPAEYDFYNTTGDVVTELYVYEAGSADKGENLAGDGLEDGECVVIQMQAENEEEAAAAVYVVEFTAGGETQSYETLHYEVTPISLKSVDAAAGATPIAFEAPTVDPAEYEVYNTTGDTVTELYVYEAGSSDKGENLAGDGLEDGASVVLQMQAETEDEAANAVYVIEFTYDGTTQRYETLHYEVVPISLKSVDAAAGATPIAFEEPAN